MQTESTMLYKLIILYILDKLDMPITNAELTRIILEKQYCPYLQLQEALDDLVGDNYVAAEDTRNARSYKITEEGSQTLSYFKNDISASLRDDIDAVLSKEQYHLRDMAASTADYYEAKKNEYIVELKIVERGSELVNINLLVASPEEADTICNRWTEANSDVYQYLITRLLAGKKPEKN